MNAIRELGLAVGKEAYAVVKATSVMVGMTSDRNSKTKIRADRDSALFFNARMNS